MPVLTVRISPALAAEIAEAAGTRGENTSEYVRRALIAALERDLYGHPPKRQTKEDAKW